MTCINPQCKQGENEQPKEIVQPSKGRTKRFCCGNCRVQYWKKSNPPSGKNQDKIYLLIDEYKDLIRKKEYGHIPSKPLSQPLSTISIPPKSNEITERPKHLVGLAAKIWDIQHQQATT